MSDLRFGFPLEYVTDIAAAKAFYVDVMNMQVERDHPVFVQFRDAEGRGYAIASDASPGGAPADLELYWITGDAEAAFAELSPLAEVTKQPTKEAFGTVFGLRDPAGQVRYILQWATNRPSTAL